MSAVWPSELPPLPSPWPALDDTDVTALAREIPALEDRVLAALGLPAGTEETP